MRGLNGVWFIVYKIEHHDQAFVVGGGGGDLANLKARGHRVYEGVWAESAQPNTGEKLSANRNRALQKNLFISVFVSYSYA